MPYSPDQYCQLLNAGLARPTRRLIVLGASGSVGETALEYLRARRAGASGHSDPNGSSAQKAPHGDGTDLALTAVSVHGSVDRLRAILAEFAPRRAAITRSDAYDRSIESLRRDFPAVQFYRGESGAIALIEEESAGETPADTVLTALVGAAGIQLTMRALELGLKIALANKETMVTAGPAIEALLCGPEMQARKPEERPVIMPVDSEHNAVFQLIYGLRPDHIRRVILTASGGPFRDMPVEQLSQVSREQVLNHPTWSMGPKITVDSAGMVNKGLEIIEAHYLFSLPYDALDALIHRHSLVHGLVETTDGGYLVCASRPHMCFPVAHALHYPAPAPEAHRFATPPQTWQPIEFEEVSRDKYPGFGLCLAAGRRGGTAPAVLNAANEQALQLFQEDAVRFVDIPVLIEETLNGIPNEQGAELGLFLEADRRAREFCRNHARARTG